MSDPTKLSSIEETAEPAPHPPPFSLRTGERALLESLSDAMSVAERALARARSLASGLTAAHAPEVAGSARRIARLLERSDDLLVRAEVVRALLLARA